MGQCHPPVPSYQRGRRDQKDPPLRRQTYPPLPPHPWNRPLPWAPGSPWTCAATGTRVALGTLARNQIARRFAGSAGSAGSQRPVLFVPAPSGSAYISAAKRVLMLYTLMTLTIFPFLCKTFFFTVSSGNAMTALTLNNLSSAHKVGGGGKGRSRTRVSRRHKHPHSHHDGCHYHGSQHELLYGAHVGEPSLSRVVDHASWIVGIVLLLIMHVGGRRRHVVYSSQDGAHVMNVAHFDVATFAKVSCTHCLFFTYLDLLKFLYAG
ncbi:hypothetical protein GGRV_ORF28L [German gecko ranavirus]|uniref:Uncharacterized protein n=1 Tax=German gecko ranavirus TaxID=1620702 RepID=A0A0D3R3D6_FRG3V|nr:hypothetical protein GGRV_ORF28L [German gecko ranavirus]